MPRGKILTEAAAAQMRQDGYGPEEIAQERKALALVGDGVGAGVVLNEGNGELELLLTEDTVLVSWQRQSDFGPNGLTGYLFEVTQITQDAPTCELVVASGEPFRSELGPNYPFLERFVEEAFKLLETGLTYEEIRDKINNQANTPAGQAACERWLKEAPVLMGLEPG